MEYITRYQSPLGEIVLAGRDGKLTGLWFQNQKYFGSTMEPDCTEEEIQVFADAKQWLDSYFAGENPKIDFPLAPKGSAFRQMIWKILCEVPYGEVITYGEIAARAAAKMGRGSMSAQAAGGAVGHNPVSVVIPCHRVVGADGSLTGYAGGLKKKQWLLELERQGLIELR